MSSNQSRSYVIDRHGNKVDVKFDRITSRIQSLCYDEYYGPQLDLIDPITITQNVIKKFSSGITTKELDRISIDDCNEHTSHNEQYEYLAARLAITGSIHKETSPCIKEATNALIADGFAEFSDEFVGFVNTYYDQINNVIDHRRDFRLKYFSYCTLLKYLKRGKRLIERPQHLYMRVALTLFCGTPQQDGHLKDPRTIHKQLEQAFEFYHGLSMHYYSCASPIMLNSGCKVQQVSSCFLLSTGDDLDTLLTVHKDCGMISKWAGGIGVWLSSIRAEGAQIGNSGIATGIKHYVKMMNELQNYVNQRGLRKGAFAMYLEPWHYDIFTFLEDLPRTHDVHNRLNAPDLKYALWIPDNFMRALQVPNGKYYLFSPDECPRLYSTHGAEFEHLYNEYVQKGLDGKLKLFKEVLVKDIVRALFETLTQNGTPYILYKDTINKLSNMKNVATIASSNLCVSGDTYVLTSKGQYPIKDLVDQNVEVWNGEQWSQTTVKQTGSNQQLLRINFSNGTYLDCTEYHKFYDRKGNELRTHELKIGTELEKIGKLPIIKSGDEPFKYAYTHGLFTADGCYDRADNESHRCTYTARYGNTCSKHQNRTINEEYPDDGKCRVDVGKRPILQLYHDEKMVLVPYIEFNETIKSKEDIVQKRIRLYLHDDIAPKFTVPMNNDLDSKLRWFEGYCDGDGDGCIVKNGTTYGIQCSSTNLVFLQRVRLMLQTMGCDPKIGIMHESRINNIKGVDYNCNQTYRLLISAYDLNILRDLGFAPNRLTFDDMAIPNRDARRFVEVQKIEQLNGLYDTYCFNEPLRHRGIFNGIITGNCAEITIPSWTAHNAAEFGQTDIKSEYGCCNLASMCLKAYVKDGIVDYSGIIENVKKLVRALDTVIDINYYPAEPARRSNLRHRPIGIGVMGLADVFHSLKLVFGSKEARDVDQAIAACIYYGAMYESSVLAEELGAYESFEFNNGAPAMHGILQPDLHVEHGYLRADWQEHIATITDSTLTASDWDDLRSRVAKGIRNAYVTAYMPTASTANIASNNECFEPYTSNIYKRSGDAGEFIIANNYLIDELNKLDMWTDRTRKSIMLYRGSVQHLNIPNNLKERFKTSWELDQKVIINHARARGAFICQSQSMNLYHKNLSMQNLITYMLYGWKSGLKTGCYYTRTQPVDSTIQAALLEYDDALDDTTEEDMSKFVCRRDDPTCMACQ